MPVLVRFDKRKAFLRDGRWRSADKALESSLNETTMEWIRATGGPSLSDADQERTVAEQMAERWGGKVLIHMPSRSGKSAAYFVQQRQLKFEFGSPLPAMSRRATSAG